MRNSRKATGRVSSGARVGRGLSDFRAWQWGQEWDPLQLSVCSGDSSVPSLHLFITYLGTGGGRQMRSLSKEGC